MFLISLICFFFHGDIELQRVRSDKNSLLWFFTSFTFEKSSILQCRRLLPIAITNKKLFVRLELENSVFLHFVLLRFTPVASNSFSFPSLRSSYTATLSSTCFWIFLPSRIQSGEETDVGRQRFNHSSLSLCRFSELNKALNTNEYNWWRVFIFLPQELQTRPDLSSTCNILFARINEPVCIEGWNKFSVPIWSPWEPNLTRRRRRCQLGLLSINFVFRNVIFQPIVFPFVWVKYKWNFMRDCCKLSFSRILVRLALLAQIG